MRYSIEPTDRRHAKGYGFLPFAKDIGKNLSKYSQKLLDSAKKSTTDATKTAFKRAFQKIAEATDDLIGNETADKITSVSKKSSKKLHSKETNNEIPKERYISPKEVQQIIDEIRLT